VQLRLAPSGQNISVSEPASIILTGRAYQRRATLEIKGEALTWRAQRGQVYSTAENIATSMHDVTNVMWLERRGTIVGGFLAALSLVWLAYGNYAFGGVGLGVALLYVAWRFAHPMRFLGLQLGGRWLVLRVDDSSANEARALVSRIEQHLLTGDAPARPPALP
jgi:hypothetical protein